MTVNGVVKQAHQEEYFSVEEIKELKKCLDDPIYFMENYIKIQHPTKGQVPLNLYGFQKNLVNTYHNYRNVIALLSRQMGKSITSCNLITKNKSKVEISSLVSGYFFINKLEKLKLELSKYL